MGEARQPCERCGLVPVGREAFVPLEVVAPVVRGSGERQPQPHVGAAEHAGRGAVEELREGHPGAGVVEREGRAQVLEQAAPLRLGLRGGEELARVAQAAAQRRSLLEYLGTTFSPRYSSRLRRCASACATGMSSLTTPRPAA